MATNTIEQLDTVNLLHNNDLFVVSQQDRYIAKKYNTESISSENLVDVLINKVMQDDSFKSSIFFDNDAFSPYDHKHDDKYNKISLGFAYDINDESETMLSVGNMFFDGTLSTIAIPKSFVTTIFTVPFTSIEPNVGTLKFVANANILRTNDNINYKSDDFDGWLYPDGSKFNLNDFALSTQLDQLYGNGDHTTFTLPDLRTFLKFNNDISGQSLIDYQNAKVELPRHSHDIDCSITGTCTITLSTRVGNDAGNTLSSDPYNMLHDGNGTILSGSIFGFVKKISDVEKNLNANDLAKFRANDTLLMKNIKVKIDAPVSFSNSIVVESYSYSNETYPSHVMLPVMIYVGQKVRRYYE